MTFSECYGYVTFQLELNPDGRVFFSEWSDHPHSGGAWSGGPSSNFSQCTLVLDKIGSRSPSIYRKVYEHIQHQKEPSYVTLANYCKQKNNEFARKFQVID